MATRRANSSSNPPQPKKPPPPKPSSSSQKPLPNYLKPTISSSLDFSSRTSRRSNTDASASTATSRRHSYDKPPSPAHLQKALHASTVTTTRTRPSSTKPVPQKSFSSLSSRFTKAAPARPVMRRSFSAKASPTNSSTSSLNRVAREAGPRCVTSESSVEFEGRDRDPLHQEEKLAEALHTEIKEPKNEGAVVAGEEVEQEAVPCEKEELPVAIAEERSNGEEAPTQCEKEELPVVAEEERSNGEEAPCEKEELPVVTEEERSIDKCKEETETEYGVNQGKGEENDTGDLNKVDEKHVVVELGESAEGSKEGEETSVQVVQVKTESPTTAKADQMKMEHPTIVKVERPAKQMQPGKKEKQAYNDVIEETAGKLMERRNRVRALAGAFETVISLQDTK